MEGKTGSEDNRSLSEEYGSVNEGYVSQIVLSMSKMYNERLLYALFFIRNNIEKKVWHINTSKVLVMRIIPAVIIFVHTRQPGRN